MRTVWFHRNYTRFQGGHLKHSHYFSHVGCMPGFVPRITFSGEPATETLDRERLELWPPGDAGTAANWAPRPDDLLFVAGVDWRYLAAGGFDAVPNPRVNLIQHVRHAHKGTELYGYLANRAVRICVSQEVADAIAATGRVNGPVLTIPNGIEAFSVQTTADAAGSESRPVVIAGYKEPGLAKSLADRLVAMDVEHTLLTEFLAREKFLELLAGSRVAVCLPRSEEGFYLPALEAMAAGCLVVTLDCIGNRSFCTHEGNCLIADPTAESLAVAVQRALGLGADEGQHLRSGGAATVSEYSLVAERKRFHAVLRDIDRLWASVQMSPACHPQVNFMVIGAQKCGTTALAHFLAQHPLIRMSSEKEPHLFDASDYSPKWTPDQINERYRPYFARPERTPTIGKEGTPAIGEVGAPTVSGTAADGPLRGEATPIYLFLPEIAPELKRYNPELKVIVLLRDPVDRAISHYYMEKNKGYERLPLWLALLGESWRLWRCGDHRQHGSAWRRHSYRRRGLYSVQLRNLFRHFDARQVMVVRAEDLARHHDAVLKRVFQFLEVSDYTGIEARTVFEGERDGRRHALISWLLRMSFVPEFVRMRRFKIASVRE